MCKAPSTMGFFPEHSFEADVVALNCNHSICQPKVGKLSGI